MIQRTAPIIVVMLLVGCISAETQRALDEATQRMHLLEQKAGDLRADRDALLVKLEQGLISLADYEAEMAKLKKKITGLELEEEIARKELEEVKEKAAKEREVSFLSILTSIDTGLEVGSEVAAGLPSLGFIVPILGLFRLGVGVFLKRKG